MGFVWNDVLYDTFIFGFVTKFSDLVKVGMLFC